MYPFVVEDIIALAKQAGTEVTRIYNEGFTVTQKSDLSPVTQADIACERIIFEGLSALTPDIPIVGEEHAEDGDIPELRGRFFWLVDPIDGTKEFIKKNGEFTVNIALVEEDVPVFGVVYAPIISEMYFTQSPAQAFSIIEGRTTLLKTRPAPFDGVDVLCSRSHCNVDEAQKMLGRLSIKKIIRRGSSLKFCDIAAGRGDVYPCTHATHEWDTAAAHAVLNAAGGILVTPQNRELKYRKSRFENPKVLTCGDVDILNRL